MGYGDTQVRELEATINKCPAAVVVSGTPIDLTRLITLKPGKTMVRVRYEYSEISKPGLKKFLELILKGI